MPTMMLALAALLAACQSETAETVSRPATPDDQAVATAASGMPAEKRKFRDWIVACDNGNACAAIGPGDDGMGFVRVAIQPGPDALPGVTVGLFPPPESGDRSLTIQIDDRTFPVSEQRDADPDDPPLGVVQAETPELIRAMAEGEAMTLGAGEEAVAISLSGASAALLWIDERQGRLDTPTALIRRGDERPAGAVPSPPSLPRVPVAPAVSQVGLPDVPVLPDSLARDPAVLECAADVSHLDAEFTRPTVARLSDGVELWGVSCFAGAYNFGTAYWITGEGGRDPRPAVFAGATGEADNVLVNAAYDPDTRTIAAFNKGRGLGDCGVDQAWVWSGRAFVLIREASMSECWGVPSDLWPTTWRTVG